MSLRRLYETTFIVNAALEDPDVESVIAKVSSYIENHGAEILSINKWGRRRLAYPINKKFNGYYVHMVYEANTTTIPIFERFLVLEDTVLRHLTLILPKKLRDFRAKRAAAEAERLAQAALENDIDENEEQIGPSEPIKPAEPIKLRKKKDMIEQPVAEPEQEVGENTATNEENA